jgi:hypothetical protein
MRKNLSIEKYLRWRKKQQEGKRDSEVYPERYKRGYCVVGVD